ncbi:MAG TPA: site-specific DNA-methyltransferase [Pirellulaceae bacterium]|nr:site-specific DNA-methyltransferase [Pirellulaceae bacterium]
MKSEHVCSWIDQVHCGDARDMLLKLPKHTIDTVVTSPPYFRQRNYEHPNQLGNEISAATYVQNLVEVFDGMHQALKPTGSLWVVLGDKYENSRLLGLPWRFALAMIEAGWYLRSDVIWHKPNAMPSSVKNRPTTDHEYVFFFTRGRDYYYDADAIREPHVTFTENSRMKGGRNHFGKRGGTPEQGKNGGSNNLHDGRWDQFFHPKGRNKRTVWSIPLSKFRGAHFAVFPAKLVENCILATCPERGIVLDPFSGSGTTALVAKQLKRSFIAIDCNPDYCDMARQRLNI